MLIAPKTLGAGSVVGHPLSVVLLVVSIATPGLAGPVCTLVMEAKVRPPVAPVIGDKCETRVSPSSTFDIALSLMGFDSGLLTTPDSSTWPNGADNLATVEDGQAPTTPRTWLRNSDGRYSQELAKALGSARLQQYVDNMYFGNRDLTGDAGENNGLTQAWLSSSLQISPGEQIQFLRMLLLRDLPFSAEAVEETIASMPVFPARDGWTVRGVTGTGFQRKSDGTRDPNRQFGWFVRWADRAASRVVFVRLVEDEVAERVPAGIRARDTLLAELPGLAPRDVAR
jgi:beta-lactamase class D